MIEEGGAPRDSMHGVITARSAAEDAYMYMCAPAAVQLRSEDAHVLQPQCS